MRRLPRGYSKPGMPETPRLSAWNREFPDPRPAPGSAPCRPEEFLDTANTDGKQTRCSGACQPRGEGAHLGVRSGRCGSGTSVRIRQPVPALRRWAAAAAAAAITPFAPAAAEVTVFAAASLTAAAAEVFEGEAGTEVSLSFAASSVLARQIDAGAPADLFLSANRAWMDFLEQRGRIDTATRVDLLANRLAVVAPAGSGLDSVEIAGDFDFPGSFSGRLALGDPDHVPAGMYAKQALVGLGWWSRLEPRLAPAPDARAALVFVERGACSAGIVYTTDAAASDRVEVAAEIPDSLHEPILYPAAVVAGRDSPQVRAAMARMLSPAAARIFRRHGFAVLPRPRVTSRPE